MFIPGIDSGLLEEHGRQRMKISIWRDKILICHKLILTYRKSFLTEHKLNRRYSMFIWHWRKIILTEKDSILIKSNTILSQSNDLSTINIEAIVDKINPSPEEKCMVVLKIDDLPPLKLASLAKTSVS